MKLERLHLLAFGAFDDHTLDLTQGDFGLHLIYGPNEAGKSTTLRAITQLLYGIDTRTTDSFRHPHGSLRIGATLSNGKDSLTFYRRKGNKATLLADDNKSALDDGVLGPFLGGVDLEAFTHLFGLSHETLVRGGQALVQGEGDVGQALFSAAAGLGSLRTVLDRLEAAAGDLFKPSGTIPRINKNLSDYRKAVAATKLAQKLPTEWAKLAKALDEMRSEREALLASIKTLVAEQSRLERIEKALPLVGQHKEVLGKLEALKGTVVLPEDFSARRSAAVQDLAAAKEQHRVAEASLARVVGQLDVLEIDEDLLAQEARIEKLHGVHQVIQKALDDKQRNLEPALRQHHTDIARLLRDLSCDGDRVEELRPEPGITQRINQLASDRMVNEKDDAHAGEQVAKLVAARKAAHAALEKLDDVPDTSALDLAIQGARPVAATEDDMAERALAVGRLQKRIDDALARLAMPEGSGERLESLAVPGARAIEQMRLRMESEEGERRRCREEQHALESELADTALQLDAFKRTQNVPSESTLMSERATREAAWRKARAAWEKGKKPESISEEECHALLEDILDHGARDGNLADVVEWLTQRADDTADRLRRESDRAATVAQLEARHGAVEKKLADLATVRVALEKKAEETGVAWLALWTPLGMTPRTPAEMAEWHGEYATVLTDLTRLKEEAGLLGAYEARATKQRKLITSALADLGHTPEADESLSGLVAMAESWADGLRKRMQQRDQLRSQLAETESDLTALEQTVDRITASKETWSNDWSDMMSRIGARPDASPVEAVAKLELLEELFDTRDKAAELEGRIAQIDAENEAYLEEVEGLAHVASAAGSDQPREMLVPALFQALKAHRQRATEQAGLLKQRMEQEETLAASEAALERAENELADCCALARVNDLKDLEDAESLSRQYRALQNDQSSLEARLLDISPGLGLHDFLAMVASEDPNTIPARLHAIGPEREEAEVRRDALSQSIGERENELAAMDGSDTAAVLADDAEALLASIADDARQYARLKVAHRVLNDAIERYRVANQEPLLARASEIFSTLTLDSFQELRADFDSKENHVLCGYRVGVELPVHVAGMSEGTADQLFLALRLASLERHLEKHPPIPFVLDDILVNFDDARAVATLKVLGELSARTQVIYFTHHAHLVDLAKAHVSKKQLVTHTLGA